MRPRRLTAVLGALFLTSILPATVIAEPATRFEDHHIGFFCEQPVDVDIATSHIDVNIGGASGGAEIWAEGTIPFEGDPAFFGGSEDVQLTAVGDGFELSVTFAVLDTGGAEVGEGSVEASLTPDGDPELFTPERDGNRQTLIEGSFQSMAVSGTLTMPSIGTVDLEGCGGDETFIKVLETNPHAFVGDNEGVVMDCFWETEDAVAGVFVIDDSFGPFAEAFLSTPEGDLFATGAFDMEFTTESLSAVIDLVDTTTESPEAATAAATFEPFGDMTTSIILSATTREKLIEQRLDPTGELTFSTGPAFEIDFESCFANTFDSHAINTGPAGPKAGGKAPVNDTLERAIALTTGSNVNVQTGGAAIEPEAPISTCPDGEEDKMGRTVWYTFEGTGEEVTLDTAGSNFDTVLAVYVLDGDELVEIACVDDVFLDPIGVTFQAAISGPSEVGVTYFIQIGGFDARDFGGDVEFGRLRVALY